MEFRVATRLKSGPAGALAGLLVAAGPRVCGDDATPGGLASSGPEAAGEP